MTQLNYSLPVAGQPNASEDPKVHDALQQILTVINGSLGADNVQDASITAAELAAAEAWRVIGAVSQPAFANSWAQEAAQPVAAFYKDIAGVVHLKGSIQNGVIGQAAFTLPAGYRPLENNRPFTAYSLTGGGPTIGRVDVMANGQVIPALGGNVRMTLDNISFRAEQ